MSQGKSRTSRADLTEDQKTNLEKTDTAIRNFCGIPVRFRNADNEKYAQYGIIIGCGYATKIPFFAVEYPVNSGIVWKSVSAAASMMWLATAIVANQPPINKKGRVTKFSGQCSADGYQTMYYFSKNRLYEPLCKRRGSGTRPDTAGDLLSQEVISGDKVIDLTMLHKDQPVRRKQKIPPNMKDTRKTRGGYLTVPDLIKYGALGKEFDDSELYANLLKTDRDGKYIYLPPGYDPTGNCSNHRESAKKRKHEDSESEDETTESDEDEEDAEKINTVVLYNNEPPSAESNFLNFFDNNNQKLMHHLDTWKIFFTGGTVHENYKLMAAKQLMGITFDKVVKPVTDEDIDARMTLLCEIVNQSGRGIDNNYFTYLLDACDVLKRRIAQKKNYENNRFTGTWTKNTK